MAEIAKEPKVDDRPSLYIRDDYARQLPSGLDIGDIVEFTARAEVTGINKSKYEGDEEDHISFDFKINSMVTGLNEEKIIKKRTALGTTSLDSIKKVFDSSNVSIIFKKED